MSKPIIYATADTHGNLPSVPSDAEILIMAGDVCPDFRPKGVGRQWSYVDDTGDQQLTWLKDEFKPWLQELSNRGTVVVAVAGNHDFVLERQPSKVAALELPWVLLKDSSFQYVYEDHFSSASPYARGSITMYGLPWVPGLPYWAYFADEDKMREVTDKIPEGLDILISHGPPSGAGDFIPRPTLAQQEKYGSDPNGERVGSTWLRGAILEKKPKLTVCGHIHEDRGMHQIQSLPGAQALPRTNALDVWNISAVKPGTYDLVVDPVVRLHF